VLQQSGEFHECNYCVPSWSCGPTHCSKLKACMEFRSVDTLCLSNNRGELTNL